MDEKYFECTRIIRKSEYEKNQMPYVLYWEEWLLEQMEKSFVLMKENNKKKRWKELRKMAVAERKHPLFYKLNLCRRLRFWICFFAYPLYKNYYNEQETASEIELRFRYYKEHYFKTFAKF